MLLLAAVWGVIAIIPYALTLLGPTLAKTPLPIPLEMLILLQIVQNMILFAGAIAIGLFFAYRIGLGAPILEAIFAREDWRAQVKAHIAPSIVLGVIATLVLIAFDLWLFAPLLKAQLGSLADTLNSQQARPPAWQGFLASFYGGIDEEILMRLCLLSLCAWLGKFISHTAAGRPTSIVLWIANLIVAIIFGLGHLPATALIIPITPLVVTRAIVLNGIVGIATGYLYFTRGLESAMLAHFSADLILHVLLTV